jgi:hypothetical protein
MKLTPIRGRDTITAAEVLQKIRSASPRDVRPSDTADYVRELVTLCGAFGLRHTVLLAQWHHETGGGGPEGRWRELNPAGLGITSSADQTPYKLLDGTEAAALHVWSMLVALREWGQAERIILPPAAIGWIRRWAAKYRDEACPLVNSVEDLNRVYSGDRATWATDPAYHTKLLATMSRLFPATGESDKPVSITYGNVPHPAYHDRPIWKAEGKGQNNLGKRTVKGVVWHRMLGSLTGTDGWFRRGDVDGLTDYGIGVQSTDGKTLNGVIYRWNDPLGYQSGWASGKVIAPWGDGAAFINKYGINAVNRDQVSVEISGQYGTALTDPSRDAIAALTAYYADQYGIPWDVFPIAPQDGFSFVRWHQEFTGPQEKVCPGAVVIAETNDLIERTRAIMKRYQTESEKKPDTPDGATYAAPLTYPWLAREVAAAMGEDQKIGRTTVYYFPQVYTAIEDVPRLQHAGKDAPEIGPVIEPGVRFGADYVFRSGNVSWVLTPFGTRVRASALLPKIQITRGGTISVRRKQGGEPEIGRAAPTG